MNSSSPTPFTAGKGSATIIVLLVIIIAVLVIFLVPRGRVEAPTSDQVATTTPAGIVVTSTKQSSEQPSYNIDTETPVVSGMADAVIQKKINDQLAAKVKEITADFRSQAVNTPVTSGTDTKSGLGIEMSSYDTVKDAVLTVRMTMLIYFSGAAHPIMLSEASNFDMKTGVDLNLIDIFDTAKGVAYLTAISEYTTKELKAHLAKEQNLPPNSTEVQFFEEGSNSNPENFQTFLVEDSGIRFIFTQYQVAPYAAGEQEVLMPYAELKKFMKEGALTGALTR